MNADERRATVHVCHHTSLDHVLSRRAARRARVGCRRTGGARRSRRCRGRGRRAGLSRSQPAIDAEAPAPRIGLPATHRFNGNLREGSFNGNASNLFGLDQGAAVGFEYRFGIARHLQAAVYRTAIDKTFQFYGKYDAVRQGDSVPLSLSALVSVEGADNFQERYSPALGVVVSRTAADRLAVYATPIWVQNTAANLNIDRDTFFVGIGGRVRVTDTVYLVGEVAPRASGYRPDRAAYGFAIEKRAGGHLFQLNFNNGQGTTLGQLARGGFPDSLYLGFNLARKFF
jgi:hypothetical protein